ncbi:MAG TPA: signal peptidase I [Steroidobacteraceae bacterium]|nr:signal peptidase I [Steroidobacteraceae bacterium]
MFDEILRIFSWLLLPVLVIVIVDDWFLRPRRRLAALPARAADPEWLVWLYNSLLLLLVAGALRVIRSERLDFALALVVISAVGGVVWALDAWVLRPQRDRAARAQGKDPLAVPEPGVVDYARSMVPVVVLVLVLRSFLFEPFRIPSDSMMPTLQDGDFILVNKFAYGLRLPVLNTRILGIGEPQRGDVVVFRYPPDPGINYIKRVVGLPGDRVKVVSDHVYVNGVPLPNKLLGHYSDGCYQNMRLSEVQTGNHVHHTLSCLTPDFLAGPPLPGCNRKIDRGYVCSETDPPLAGGVTDRGDAAEVTVPAGNYLMIGDNRDNSEDGRYWGFVPEANLVGSARRVWFNFDFKRHPLIDWSRIGRKID